MQGNNPYKTPESHLETTIDLSAVEYVGFWRRFVANFIDGFLIMLLLIPLVILFMGDSQETEGGGNLLFTLLQMGIIITFWVYKSATPGKMLMSAYIVDANTGDKPSTGQFIIRYLMYFVSTIVLFLGFIWIAFDSRKQGWHDKVAGTVVIRKK
jgi:uncharacterized RDD family membrane protein YckC